MGYGLSNIIIDLSSSIVFFVLIINFIRMKNKTQIHYMFIIDASIMLFWILGRFLEEYFNNKYGYSIYWFMLLFNVCIALIPLAWLLTSYVFMYNKINIDYKTLLLSIFPIASIIMVATNDFHHLYYIEYTSFLNKNVYGWYYLYPHCIYSYGYMFLGLFNVMYFSIKYQGFLSKQIITLFIGVLIPVFTDISITFFNVPTYLGSIGFSITAITVMYAITKFKFLKITPIALKSIIDNISDAFVVIDQKYDIIEYNKVFVDNLNISNASNFKDILTSLDIEFNKYIESIESSTNNKVSYYFEDVLSERNYTIEITPIFLHNRNLGTVIMFKDITEHKKVLKLIKKNKSQEIEKDRLISLNQLIGGIAHNLKTPIMSSSGGILIIKEYINELSSELKNNNIENINLWLDRLSEYISYMSDVISTVKEQIKPIQINSSENFKIRDLYNSIIHLMSYELKSNKCILNFKSNIDLDKSIKGNKGLLVQVINNILSNSIESYKKKGGQIYFNINLENNNVVFSIKDFGTGIQKNIQEKLFKEMITTKGKDGTGLGLYISKSIIKGYFDGSIWFDSTKEGTTFYISIRSDSE